MQKEDRGGFGSRIGAILAAAGCAVGLGNIWRFPTEVGNNGGGAFILVYIGAVFFIAMPVMISEFVIGRASHSNAVDAFRSLSKGKFWSIAGYLSVLAGILVLSYYSVVAGWTLYYSFSAVSATLSSSSDYAQTFSHFVSHPFFPLIALAVFLLLTHLVVVRGIQNGIERYSKMMMPLLFILMLVLVVYCLTMSGVSQGLDFLFHPDFSKITSHVVLSAMGQAFFSLSVGIGCLITYSSYFRHDTRLVSSALEVSLIDTLVAILSGCIIFPAVFSVPGVSPDAGPGLVFITLPHVFDLAFSDSPVMYYVFSVFFYLLLLLAALTSSISMHEISTAYIRERFQMSRTMAASIVSLLCLLLGVICSLSFGPWEHIHLFGLGFFDLFDFITAKLLMPIGGLLITVFAGWYLNRKVLHDELTNRGTLPFTFLRLVTFLIRWVAPIGVCVIFVNEIVSFFSTK